MTVDQRISIPLFGDRQQCTVFDFFLLFPWQRGHLGCFSGHLRQALVSHPGPGDYY
jgi:hypothetical protein